MSDRVGEVTGQNIESAEVLLAPIIAVQGLRQAYALQRQAIELTKHSIGELPSEVTAPEGHYFTVSYARNPRPVSNGFREVRKGIYTPPDGIHPPILEESTPEFIGPDEAPFRAVIIAAAQSNLIAVGPDGIGRQFYPDKGDQVELVPIPTEQQASTAQ